MSSILFNFLVVVSLGLGQTEAAPEGGQGDGMVHAENVTIQLEQGPGETATALPVFAARFTIDDLIALILSQELSPQLSLDDQRTAAVADLKRVSLGATLVELEGYLAENFAGRLDLGRDLITVPVPQNLRVSIETPDLEQSIYIGPTSEVIGFLVNGVNEAELRSLSVRLIQTARRLLDSGNPAFDRSSAEYYRLLAEHELAGIRDGIAQAEAAVREAEAVRARVAEALGLTRDDSGQYAGEAKWRKESRRFSYIVKEGQFIQRLESLVERINREMAVAGFPAPSELDLPGIYYDAEIGDVDIVLPQSMFVSFLEQADSFERRMAEDAIISIEAVRLTDRDIVSAALASRLDAQFQGVHDSTSGFSNRTVLRELGINSLLAVANQGLQAQTLGDIAAGGLPPGVTPVQIAPPTLPPIQLGREATTIGTTFSVGADPLFFDGREQVYGFSYIGPDGISHSLSLSVVDSLRSTWERIERNLIVHKIKKTGTLTPFTVPVGPDTRTFNGIAALISQENQTLIVSTGTGAIEKTDATAGTWLIVEDFEITPIPGSSTTLTKVERDSFETKILLTMLLRDPYTDVDTKCSFLGAGTTDELRSLLLHQFESVRDQRIRPGREALSYGSIFDARLAASLSDEGSEKKERNSMITLTFYSSQGTIVQNPGSNQLGDANDVTSFTTVLSPNVVTPISSFFTKSGMGTKGASTYTGNPRGERADENKTMTHLVVRARFPTVGRENKDRDEGRFTGYFDLPIKRAPSSEVDLPFLSSSEHPVERLARLRFGLMFASLDRERIIKPIAFFNPQQFPGEVPREVWETATTRALINRKLISDSPGRDISMASDYGERFIVAVRSLLEYDPDFFNAAGYALRNMTQWNNPDRIVQALNGSPQRFALNRLVAILDELGEQLIPDDFAKEHLAYCPEAGWADRRIYPLSAQQLRSLRRDVAVHRLRFQEYYGDAMLEAASQILGLGTYRGLDHDTFLEGPFRGYHDLVLFDKSGHELADPKLYAEAHRQFMFLKAGGYEGKLFEQSVISLEHLPEHDRAFIYRGTDILSLRDQDENYSRWTRK